VVGKMLMPAPAAHVYVAVRIVPAGFCVNVIVCGVRLVKLSEVALAVTAP
jgi:hypothetical protein